MALSFIHQLLMRTRGREALGLGERRSREDGRTKKERKKREEGTTPSPEGERNMGCRERESVD